MMAPSQPIPSAIAMPANGPESFAKCKLFQPCMIISGLRAPIKAAWTDKYNSVQNSTEPITAIGIDFSGFLVSPASEVASLKPRNENTTADGSEAQMLCQPNGIKSFVKLLIENFVVNKAIIAIIGIISFQLVIAILYLASFSTPLIFTGR